MPGIWKKATQKLYETFMGKRTKDLEFESKAEELKLMEKSVMGIKLAYHNFAKNTQGYKQFCKDMYSSLSGIYDFESPYRPIINEMVEAYQLSEKQYDDMATKVQEIDKIASQWDSIYVEVKKAINQRNELRTIYDHYDAKFEELVIERNQKLSENKKETQQEIQMFERVNIFINYRMN